MKQKKVLFFISAIVVIILVGLGVIFFASNRVGEKKEAAVTVSNENGSVAGAQTQGHDQAWIVLLARDLSQKGMVMYGAYWCSHCQNQKKTFGDAFQYVDYVECDAQGPNANPDECVAKGVTGYPTWIYQGKQYSGEQSLDELARIVGFTGPADTTTDAAPASE